MKLCFLVALSVGSLVEMSLAITEKGSGVKCHLQNSIDVYVIQVDC